MPQNSSPVGAHVCAPFRDSGLLNAGAGHPRATAIAALRDYVPAEPAGRQVSNDCVRVYFVINYRKTRVPVREKTP